MSGLADTLARRRERADERRLTRRRRTRRLGLRSRITLTFAFGAFAIAGGVAAITYQTTRNQIVSQAEKAIQTEFLGNANILAANLGHTSASTLLRSFDTNSSSCGNTASSATPCSVSLLREASTGGRVHWINLEFPYVDCSDAGCPDIPAHLASNAEGNQASSQVIRFKGATWMVLGAKIQSLNVTFFQFFNLKETSDTLKIILASLIGAAIITTLVGAIIGRWAAGRTLRPLRDVSRAALEIASGKLDTRLEPREVSDLAVLASSFNRMVDRLQQRIIREARFTSDVSHELRSPLTTLATSLAVIEARRDELPERARQALTLLSAEIARFQRMVSDLLEISRLDAGSADVQMSLVTVGDLVTRALQSSQSEVPVEMPEGVARRQILVDKRRFERIIANLVENAERYAEGPTRIGVEATEEMVRVSVEDAGGGIAPEERERIFERFARGSAAAGSRGAGGGTGLGLALVAEHVKLHEGRVWVEDSPRGGARFVVELPLAPRDDEADVSAELAGLDRAEPSPNGRR